MAGERSREHKFWKVLYIGILYKKYTEKKRINSEKSHVTLYSKYTTRALTFANVLGEKKKVTLITHSMGALVTRCLIQKNTALFENSVDRWIAVAAPHQGAGAKILLEFLQGYSFIINIIILFVYFYLFMRRYFPVSPGAPLGQRVC